MPGRSEHTAIYSMLGMCALIALAPPATARAELWIRPAAGTQFGTTDFDLSLSAYDSSGNDLKVRSLLAWPVDFVLSGLDAGGSVPAGRPSDRWLFEGRFETNIGDARGTMEDSDWISSRSREIEPFRFAHTNSTTDSRAFLSELSAGYRFGDRTDSADVTLEALAGSRAELYIMTARGARGQYLNEDQTFDEVYIPSSVEAADYTVLHVLPFVGGRIVYTPLARLTVSVLGRLHYLYSYSHDDHLLRKKDAFGRAHGYGLSGSIANAVALTELVSLGISAEAYYLNGLTGTLEQQFYADDPETPGDDTELEIPDANFRVKSVRLQLMAFVKLTF